MFKFMSAISASLQNLIRVVQPNLYRAYTLVALFDPLPMQTNIDKVNRQIQLDLF